MCLFALFSGGGNFGEKEGPQRLGIHFVDTCTGNSSSTSFYLLPIMRLHSWLLSVVPLAHIAIGHGGLKILGGFDAVSNLQLRGALHSTPQVNHVMQHRANPPQQGYIDERAVNLRCGPGNGSCPAGYWYLFNAFVERKILNLH
jgi:hypothetical protein